MVRGRYLNTFFFVVFMLQLCVAENVMSSSGGLRGAATTEIEVCIYASTEWASANSNRIVLYYVKDKKQDDGDQRELYPNDDWIWLSCRGFSFCD